MNLKTYSYKKVNSTNEVAIRKIRNGISRGIIISDQQIKGKGRFGRKWISNKGNLFTTIFYPINKKINLYQLLKYNCDKIKKILKKKIKKTIIIKYPNDLLINGKKICGILQEIIEFKGEKYAVIGIGINVVTSPRLYKYNTTYVNRHVKKCVTKDELFMILKSIYRNKLN